MYSVKLIFIFTLILCTTQLFSQYELEVEGSALIHETIISEDPDIGIRLAPQRQCDGTVPDLGLSIFREITFVGKDLNTSDKKSQAACPTDYDDIVLYVQPENYSNDVDIKAYLGSADNRWDLIHGGSFIGHNFNGTGTISADAFLISRLGVRTHNSLEFTTGMDSEADDGFGDDGVIQSPFQNTSDIVIKSKDDIVLQIHENSSQQGEGELRITNLNNEELFRTVDDGRIFAPKIAVRSVGSSNLQYDPSTGEIFISSATFQADNTEQMQQNSIDNILARLDAQEKEIAELKIKNQQLRDMFHEK